MGLPAAGQGFSLPAATPNPYSSGGGGSLNPYAAPSGGYGQASYGGNVATWPVIVPGIAMVVFAVLMILLQIASAVINCIILANLENPDHASRLVGQFGGNALMLGLNGLIAVGGVNMANLKNWNSARTAAILSCICCASPLALPFGIWALVVLNNQQYKNLFR